MNNDKTPRICGKCKHRDEGLGKPRTVGTIGCDKWHQIVDIYFSCGCFEEEEGKS